ncbi:MAG: Uncharacterised protein [Hyphomonas sp. TMED17]|nr:MAG: Uncharacterised protein [Hyphomonas sp. TMED17]
MGGSKLTKRDQTMLVIQRDHIGGGVSRGEHAETVVIIIVITTDPAAGCSDNERTRPQCLKHCGLRDITFQKLKRESALGQYNDVTGGSGFLL